MSFSDESTLASLNRGPLVFERDNRIYYERRWAQASELGERAKNSKIAAIHYELALRYALLSVRAAPGRLEVAALDDEPRPGAPERARAMFGGNAEPEVKRAARRALKLA